MQGLPTTEPDLESFLQAFEAGTLPKECWTHAAHLFTGACYVHALGSDAALARMRDRVSAYNLAVGGQNTATSGYHETVTVFWIKQLAAFHARTLGAPCLASETWDRSCTISRLDFAHRAVAHFAAQRSIYAAFYDFDLLTSEEARHTWIPPSLKAL